MEYEAERHEANERVTRAEASRPIALTRRDPRRHRHGLDRDAASSAFIERTYELRPSPDRAAAGRWRSSHDYVAPGGPDGQSIPDGAQAASEGERGHGWEETSVSPFVIHCCKLNVQVVTENRLATRVPTVDEIVEENQDWARIIARNVGRKLPPQFDPGDLEQVALIETWKRAQQYDPNNTAGTPFRGYAYQYVRGAVLASVRRRAWKDASGEAIKRTDPCEKPAPDKLVEAKQHQRNIEGPKVYRQRVWLRGAIDRLKPIDAFLVSRIYIEEREVGAIAERFGMEPRAVSRRLAGIVKRLKKTRILDLERAKRRKKKRRRRA